jgi:diguanylate cyclase (GGDEF)-like protein/PAS domain S-box-containing protein
MQRLRLNGLIGIWYRIREKYLLEIGILIAIATVSSVAVLGLMQLRAEVVTRVNGSTQNLAISVTQTLDGLFDMIDVALLASADEISQQSAIGRTSDRDLTRYLELQASRLDHVAYLRSTDEFGDVVYGPGLPTQRANLSDRSFFVALKDPSFKGLFVAKPIVGKIARKPVLTLARRVSRPDGSFAGTVYASIYIEELERMLSDLNIEDGGTITIFDREREYVAGHAFGPSVVSANESRDRIADFKSASVAKLASGTYPNEKDAIAGIKRISSFLQSPKYGYFVDVGLPVDTALHQWLREVRIVFGLVFVFACALIALTWEVSRARFRQQQLIESLQTSREELQNNHRVLSNKEAEQRNLLQRLHSGVIVHGPDSKIIFSNERASELLGLSEDQMRGKVAIDPAWRFVNEFGSHLSVKEFPVSQVLASRQPLKEMKLGVQVPGQKRLVWLLVSAFPEFGATTDLQRIVVNFHDITRLREADERWRFALEGSGDGIWDRNVETNSVVYSNRYLEMLGYSEGDFEGTQEEWESLVHPDDLGRVLEIQKYQQESPKGMFNAEYRIRCKNGTYKWIYARGMVTSRGADGQIIRIVGTHTDISDLKEAENKIWHQANFDPLTGLPNRRLFYDRLGIELQKTHRDDEVIALLFIDLDHFKEVNDTLGHHIGDKLLIEAASRIKKTVRDYDTVARLGGDEFTVILVNQSKVESIGEVAEKIIERLSEPYDLEAQDTYLSASIGIALFPNDAPSVNDLVKNADQAMYAAKAAGRKCFRFFTKEMHLSATARMSLVGDLRRATASRQFELHYQPIVELSTGSINKAEALIRWNHPARGLVSPAEFIPLAEETGVIHEIGDWVFQEAVKQVAYLQRTIDPSFQISVNKSPVQFVSHGRSAHLNWLGTLKEYGLDGSSVVIEITEGVLMDVNARVAESLFQFRDAGVQVAIDDFGTGYSSLSYLKRFHIDYLKIDQSFTRNLVLASPDVALCETIILMAHKLGLRVIAEGVETQEQCDLLRSMGCDFGQGYYFSRPLSAMSFEDLLKKKLSNSFAEAV